MAWALLVLVACVGCGFLLTPCQAPSVPQAFYEPSEAHASSDQTSYRAEVVAINGTSVQVRLVDGGYQREVTVTVNEGAQRERAIAVGSMIIVHESGDRVAFYDTWRLPLVAGLIGLFFALVVIIGGRRGVMSTLGLVVSIAVIALYIIPAIVAGWSAFWVCVSGAVVIAAISLFMAHGVRHRTVVSFFAIIAILLVVTLLTVLVTHLLHISGVSDEVSFYVSVGATHISMQGLFMGGILIATLGVLDDIVTAQVAAIDELHRASPAQSRASLIGAAFSIGKEHGASLVNTLALAYAGVSLPLLVLYSQTMQGSPLLLLNSEFVVSEIVRTVIASIGILLAVPVSIYVAVWFFGRTHTANSARDAILRIRRLQRQRGIHERSARGTCFKNSVRNY